jgi:hypothetical protein
LTESKIAVSSGTSEIRVYWNTGDPGLPWTIQTTLHIPKQSFRGTTYSQKVKSLCAAGARTLVVGTSFGAVHSWHHVPANDSWTRRTVAAPPVLASGLLWSAETADTMYRDDYTRDERRVLGGIAKIAAVTLPGAGAGDAATYIVTSIDYYATTAHRLDGDAARTHTLVLPPAQRTVQQMYGTNRFSLAVVSGANRIVSTQRGSIARYSIVEGGG